LRKYSARRALERIPLNTGQINYRPNVGVCLGKDWLPFVDATRTFCSAPNPEIKFIFEEIQEFYREMSHLL